MSIHSRAQDGTLNRESLTQFLRVVHVDMPDAHGDTPLGLAIKNGHPSAVKLLLQHKAQVNQQILDGRTPIFLVAYAKQNRLRIAKLLLEYNANVNEPLPAWGNETAVMAAITHARDPELIALLVQNGASLTRKNDRGETAKDLAGQSLNPAIQRALLPKDQQSGYRPEMGNLLVSSGMFALAYFDQWKDVGRSVYKRLSDFANPQSDAMQYVDDPQTEDEFKNNLYMFIEAKGLEDFYPQNDPYVASVSRKAVQLRNDPTNGFNASSQVMVIAQLALYQPILYCDDSGSMDREDRVGAQRAIVTRMTNMMTLASSGGVHLRLINKDDNTANNLSPADVDARLNFSPNGDTNLGTNLETKVLNNFLYNPVNSGGTLPRPLLILTVTDGEPRPEGISTFRDKVAACVPWLASNGYSRDAVRFSLSQVGNDPAAKAFLENFLNDPITQDQLYITTERLDAVFLEYRNNEQELDRWILDRLSNNIPFP